MHCGELINAYKSFVRKEENALDYRSRLENIYKPEINMA
jgi:hypothetical protein